MKAISPHPIQDSVVRNDMIFVSLHLKVAVPRILVRLFLCILLGACVSVDLGSNRNTTRLSLQNAGTPLEAIMQYALTATDENISSRRFVVVLSEHTQFSLDELQIEESDIIECTYRENASVTRCRGFDQLTVLLAQIQSGDSGKMDPDHIVIKKMKDEASRVHYLVYHAYRFGRQPMSRQMAVSGQTSGWSIVEVSTK